jgi:hypothetical protein
MNLLQNKTDFILIFKNDADVLFNCSLITKSILSLNSSSDSLDYDMNKEKRFCFELWLHDFFIHLRIYVHIFLSCMY